MASVAYGGLSAAGTFATVPYVGWAVGIGAAVFDAYYVMPSLQGKRKDAARQNTVLDITVGSNQAGAPRLWAIGSAVKVAGHVMWSSSKTRSTTSSSTKGGTVTQRRVLIDAAVALNDRPTDRITLLLANGAVVVANTRNLQAVESPRIKVRPYTSGDTSPGVLAITDPALKYEQDHLVLEADGPLGPDFSLVFQVGDYVQLSNFVETLTLPVGSGTRPWSIMGVPYEVVAVTPASTGPSSITLQRRTSRWVRGIQFVSFPSLYTIIPLNVTAGSVFSPARIERIDDAVFIAGGSATPTSPGLAVRSHLLPSQTFQTGELIRLQYFTLASSTNQGQWEPWPPVSGGSGGTFSQDVVVANDVFVGTTTPFGPAYGPGTSYLGGQLDIANNIVGLLRWVRVTPSNVSSLLIEGSYNAAANYFSGTETQAPSSVISGQVTPSLVPAYRGLTYQVLDNLVGTQFGDSLPAALEAVLRVDQSMDWGRAIQTILVERCDLAASTVDVSGMTQRSFLGAYLRGPVPAITAIQPILIAGQLMVQDRDGVLAFTEFANADEAQIENGATFSDFGTRLDGETAADDKWTVEDMATEDLPTKIGIRHQDPDNQYADGYQFFGLRNPEGVDHTNEQEIDLAQMVLTRQEAANLAAVLLRRAWVNRRRYRFTLPASYIHLLESDLLTWTDDDGVQHVGRIIQRDIGSDFRVGIVAIAEDLELANYVGSPTQSAAGTPPISIPGPASLDVVIVDAPATREGQNRKPGLHIAIGYNGGPWAGAAIYESVDGTTYDLIDIVGKRAVTGELISSLAESTYPAEIYGSTLLQTTVQSVDVQFTAYAANSITSRTTKEVQSGLNWVALVKADGTTELAAFTSAVALGGGAFTLSGWLRGLRGTGGVRFAGNRVEACAAGTKIVLLNGDTYYREFSGELTPTALSYKVVPGGLSLDDVEPILHINARRNALPLPVRSVTKTIDPTTFTARFTIDANWSRAVLPLGTQPPHPMDEPVESYRFTIYAAGSTNFSQVRRVKTITASATGSNTIRDRWIEYTAAEQSADGYTPGPSTSFIMQVEQIGEFGASPIYRKTF